jgi:hypothetical protein
MEYKVIPITPVQKEKENITHIAKDFESVISKYTAEGWEYVSTESLKVWVKGNSGCFGIGATPGYFDEKQMIVFKR